MSTTGAPTAPAGSRVAERGGAVWLPLVAAGSSAERRSCGSGPVWVAGCEMGAEEFIFQYIMIMVIMIIAIVIMVASLDRPAVEPMVCYWCASCPVARTVAKCAIISSEQCAECVRQTVCGRPMHAAQLERALHFCGRPTTAAGDPIHYGAGQQLRRRKRPRPGPCSPLPPPLTATGAWPPTAAPFRPPAPPLDGVSCAPHGHANIYLYLQIYIYKSVNT